MKRRTLNPVVEPRKKDRAAEDISADAGNRARSDKDERLAPPRGLRRHRATHRGREFTRRVKCPRILLESDVSPAASAPFAEGSAVQRRVHLFSGAAEPWKENHPAAPSAQSNVLPVNPPNFPLGVFREPTQDGGYSVYYVLLSRRDFSHILCSWGNCSAAAKLSQVLEFERFGVLCGSPTESSGTSRVQPLGCQPGVRFPDRT